MEIKVLTLSLVSKAYRLFDLPWGTPDACSWYATTGIRWW
jgi:hypothetical protein